MHLFFFFKNDSTQLLTSFVRFLKKIYFMFVCSIFFNPFLLSSGIPLNKKAVGGDTPEEHQTIHLWM